MSLYNFLYNLQRKPYQTRKKVLAGLLIFSFLALAAFWVITFKKQVAEGLNGSEESGAAVLGENEKLLSPVAALIDGFKGFKDDIVKKVGEYKAGLNTADNSARPVYELPQN